MATQRGRESVNRFIGSVRADIEAKLLRGAARAGGKVIAVEAKERCISSGVADAIGVAVKVGDDRIIAKVQVKGPSAYIAPWLEYGTAPHFISVDDSQRQGMSVNRINKQHAGGSLVINGAFVGATILHPGARPHPFLRPALDVKAREAFAAAQGYINARVTPAGIVGSASEGDDQ